MSDFFSRVKMHWKQAFAEKHFRYFFIGGIIVLAILASLLPVFYKHIESRKGIVLNDWLLVKIYAANVSVYIFTILWGLILVTLYRALLAPKMILNFLYGYLFFIITRSLCLVFVPLDPPVGIIELVDPLTNIFYGGTFVTKDLFYSGHTCTVVLLYLSVEKRWDKLVFGLAALTVGTLLLVQHVHYTIDVLAAPVFAVISFTLGQLVLKKSRSLSNLNKNFI